MSTWILLRGLGRESRHWENFPQTFRDHIPGTLTLALDLPGNGRYWQQQSPCSIIAMVDHCRTQLAEQRIDPPYCLMALSLGAMVAVAWCERYPDEIARGVLMNTSFRTFSPFWQRLRPSCYPTFLRLITSSTNAQQREQHILRLTSTRRAEDTSVAESWARYAKSAPLSRRNVWHQLFAALRFRAPLVAPRVPLLILASAQDRMVDPHCSRKIAEQWNAPCALHPTAGHDLPLDDGAWVIQQTINWIENSSPKTT